MLPDVTSRRTAQLWRTLSYILYPPEGEIHEIVAALASDVAQENQPSNSALLEIITGFYTSDRAVGKPDTPDPSDECHYQRHQRR
jgi:hypothetical protein